MELRSGAPQGSILGPILFRLYISDIGHKSDNRAYIYVDDSKVLSEIKNESDVIEFQSDLEEFYYWARNNNMSFNDSKFIVLRYGRNNSLKEDTSYFTDNMGLIIEEKETHKDLGVLMSSSSEFGDHIDSIIQKVKIKLPRYIDCYCLEILIF